VVSESLGGVVGMGAETTLFKPHGIALIAADHNFFALSWCCLFGPFVQTVRGWRGIVGACVGAAGQVIGVLSYFFHVCGEGGHHFE
jgi:hypothetical protein